MALKSAIFLRNMEKNKIMDFESIKKAFANEDMWGLLTSLDLYGCSHEKITSKEYLEKYLIEVCDVIGAKRYGDPVVVKFGENEKVTGYSVTQLIETSLVSGHFADNSNAAYLDIFSCAPYDPVKVVEYSKKFFEANDEIINVIYRK